MNDQNPLDPTRDPAEPHGLDETATLWGWDWDGSPILPATEME